MPVLVGECGISPYLFRKRSHRVVGVTVFIGSSPPYNSRDPEALEGHASGQPEGQNVRQLVSSGAQPIRLFSLLRNHQHVLNNSERKV